MNHIIQPHFTLAYVKATNIGELYPDVDGESPTTNPTALSLGRYTQIDSLYSSVIFRYGLRNMLMTQRDGNSHRWFSWDVFMDAYLYDPINDRDFSNLYSLMTWSPVPWMSFYSSMQAPLLGKDRVSGCHEYNNSVNFMPWRSTEITIGHRYLNKHALLADNSQLDLRFLQRFSESWAFSGKWRLYMLDGKMDIQEYYLYHNMGSWYLGIGAFIRKNGGKDELGLGFSFTIQETGDHMPVKFL
jgi:LPS-assembly protein